MALKIYISSSINYLTYNLTYNVKLLSGSLARRFHDRKGSTAALPSGLDLNEARVLNICRIA